MDLNPESVYEEGGEGFGVYVPDGLTLDYFCGIKPMGDYEGEFFANLQNKYES